MLSDTAFGTSARLVIRVLEKLAARAKRIGRMIVVVLDNARVHQAKTTMAAFERLKHWIRPFWLPAYSPDLNDIERIWKREKEYTFANQLPETLEHFEAIIRARFRSLAHTGVRYRKRTPRSNITIPTILKYLSKAA